MNAPVPHEGPLQQQIGRLVTMAEQTEEGWKRDNVLAKINELAETDAAHLLARAELVRAVTEAHALGVPLDAAVSESGPRPWESPWVVVSVASVLVALIVALAVVLA